MSRPYTQDDENHANELAKRTVELRRELDSAIRERDEAVALLAILLRETSHAEVPTALRANVRTFLSRIDAGKGVR